jgi:hypothetical protein
MKAILRNNVTVAEIVESGDIEGKVMFEFGEVVEVLKEVKPNTRLGYKLYAIYSERLNEATVVYEGLLNFVER